MTCQRGLAYLRGQFFNMYVKVMSRLLKFLIHWPDKISVQANLAKSFQGLFSCTRIILESIEFILDTQQDLQL